jgi:hypothetical protein
MKRGSDWRHRSHIAKKETKAQPGRTSYLPTSTDRLHPGSKSRAIGSLVRKPMLDTRLVPLRRAVASPPLGPVALRLAHVLHVLAELVFSALLVGLGVSVVQREVVPGEVAGCSVSRARPSRIVSSVSTKWEAKSDE